MESMSDLDYAVFALNRMCKPADVETKVNIHYTDELGEIDNKDEITWIVSAQSTKQKELLLEHDNKIPIFVDGPNFCWVKSKMIEYYLMKTDPLNSTKEKLKIIKEYDEDDLTKAYDMFSDPFNSKALANKKPELSVHELIDGNIYAICCTGTQSKTSLYNWTKFLELENKTLRDKLIVFRIQEKSNFLTNPEKNKNSQT